ncbi:septum formation initiator family protein [Candidatus Nomurabacteria bacterium]|nr:septum formation initiator family protein [Candidatus Nomurabacteria bacterium]
MNELLDLNNRNTQKIIVLIGVLFVLYLTFAVIRVSSSTRFFNPKISNLETDISTLEEENNQLRYQLEYYKSDSYQEREARARLGLKKENESVVIIPGEEPVQTLTDQETQTKKANYLHWLEFLFG